MEVDMPAWLFHGWAEEAIAAANASGMYAVPLVGLRVAPRRAARHAVSAQWTAIDVAAAVRRRRLRRRLPDLRAERRLLLGSCRDHQPTPRAGCASRVRCGTRRAAPARQAAGRRP